MYRLFDITHKLAQYVEQDFPRLAHDSQSAYIMLLKTVLHSVNQASFTEVESNFWLRDMIADIKKLVNEVNDLARLGPSVGELLSKAMDSVSLKMRNKGASYVVLCDCLSLTEFLYLIYVFRGNVRPDEALCAVNPSGKTGTFKYLARYYLGAEEVPDFLVMSAVAEGIKNKFDCSGHYLFPEIDHFVHKTWDNGFETFEDLSDGLFSLVNKLAVKIRDLRPASTLILADHGYDTLNESGKWSLTHKWDARFSLLSPIVPILLVGGR